MSQICPRPCRRAGQSGVIVRRPKIIDKYAGVYMSGVRILKKNTPDSPALTCPDVKILKRIMPDSPAALPCPDLQNLLLFTVTLQKSKQSYRSRSFIFIFPF